MLGAGTTAKDNGPDHKIIHLWFALWRWNRQALRLCSWYVIGYTRRKKRKIPSCVNVVAHNKFELYLWSGQLRGIAALVEDVCYTTRWLRFVLGLFWLWAYIIVALASIVDLYSGTSTLSVSLCRLHEPSPKYWRRFMTEGELTCLVGGLSEYLIWLRENDPQWTLVLTDFHPGQLGCE